MRNDHSSKLKLVKTTLNTLNWPIGLKTHLFLLLLPCTSHLKSRTFIVQKNTKTFIHSLTRVHSLFVFRWGFSRQLLIYFGFFGLKLSWHPSLAGNNDEQYKTRVCTSRVCTSTVYICDIAYFDFFTTIKFASFLLFVSFFSFLIRYI